MTGANLLVLAPWLVFATGLGVICYRLASHRNASHRHRRDRR